jgi:hypothetical protein
MVIREGRSKERTGFENDTQSSDGTRHERSKTVARYIPVSVRRRLVDRLRIGTSGHWSVWPTSRQKSIEIDLDAINEDASRPGEKISRVALPRSLVGHKAPNATATSDNGAERPTRMDDKTNYQLAESAKPMRSIEEALSEVERELQVRVRCYDRWINDGKLSSVDARDRTERMQAAVHYLKQIYEESKQTKA